MVCLTTQFYYISPPLVFHDDPIQYTCICIMYILQDISSKHIGNWCLLSRVVNSFGSFKQTKNKKLP